MQRMPVSLKDKRKEIAGIFSDISYRYDFLNRVLSWGQDLKWRKKLVEEISSGKTVLDLATGTGDIAIMGEEKGARVFGLDASFEMLLHAKKKGLDRLVQGDVFCLPFLSESFDVVSCAFGLRSFTPLQKAFEEINRVLKRGGKVILLEFSRPRFFPLKILHFIYISLFVPIIGFLFSGNLRAYLYLSRTIRSFPEREKIVDLLTETGFKDIKNLDLFMGAVTLFIGRKP